MQHNITLTENEYKNIKSPYLTKGTTFAAGDTVMFTLAGHREQTAFTIASVITEKIFAGWVYLIF